MNYKENMISKTWQKTHRFQDYQHFFEAAVLSCFVLFPRDRLLESGTTINRGNENSSCFQAVLGLDHEYKSDFLYKLDKRIPEMSMEN